jgi:hypothetical protein
MRGTDHKAPIRSYIYMFINAVAKSVMLWLCLWYDFYNIAFKIKHKLRVASRSVLLQNKSLCVRASSLCFRSFEMDETWNILGPKTKKHQSLNVYMSFFWSGSCASFQMKTKRQNPLKHRESLTQRHADRAQKTQTKSLVQRSPTQCGVSECYCVASTKRAGPGPYRAVEPYKEILL